SRRQNARFRGRRRAASPRCAPPPAPRGWLWPFSIHPTWATNSGMAPVKSRLAAPSLAAARGRAQAGLALGGGKRQASFEILGRRTMLRKILVAAAATLSIAG